MDRNVVKLSFLSLSFFLFPWLSTYLPTYLSIYLSIYLFLSLCLSVRLSIDLSICKLENATSLRDLLNISTWQRQKRNNSVRLLHFSKLTTSKTKQFCEKSFKNGKLRAALTASYQCLLRFFQSICLIYCVYHRKVMLGHTKCYTCDVTSFQQTWRSDASKCNPSQKISVRTSNNSDEYISCTAPATENTSFLKYYKTFMFFVHFWQGVQPLAPATRNDIWISKSGPNPW